MYSMRMKLVLIISAVVAFLPVRLIGNIDSQTIHIYICGERTLSYQSEHKAA